ncbi:hypothetical protein HJ590_03320 [Naumannella sp. ID2617S]|nr:hypothetical protein [Naumannella sp. ID2617S]
MADALSESSDLLSTAAEPPENPPRFVPATGEGRSDRGWVSVTVRNGRLASAELREEALGLEPEDIAKLFATATNRARDAHDQQVIAALQNQQDTDLTALQAHLAELSRRAERGMDEYLASMKQLLSEASRRMQQ